MITVCTPDKQQKVSNLIYLAGVISVDMLTGLNLVRRIWGGRGGCIGSLSMCRAPKSNTELLYILHEL